MELGGLAKRAGHRLIHVTTINSTNSSALKQAGAEDTTPLWLVADQQLTGRGRQGRPWSSPPGNLYATLLLIDPCPIRKAAQLGFVAGVALLSALSKIAPGLSGLKLKWPNDLLLGGAKLAGILLEATNSRQDPDGEERGGKISGQRDRFAIAIGMGLNLAFHPDDTPYPATSMAAGGYPVSVEALFPALSDSFTQTLSAFSAGAGFSAIRERWLAAAHGIGTEITVRLPSGELAGRFAGIDAEGRLILVQGGRPRLIDTGDVYFGS